MNNRLVQAGAIEGEFIPADLPAVSPEVQVTSPYVLYISKLARNSRPIAISSLTEISLYLFNMPPEYAPWHLMRAEQFLNLKDRLRERHPSPKTAHRKICMVRSVLKYAYKSGIIPDSHKHQYQLIMAEGNVRHTQGRGVVAPHRNISDDEIARLMQVLAQDRTVMGTRDMAMFACFRGCGLRRMEVEKLQLQSIRFGAGEYGEILIDGKGGKQRVMPMPKGLREIILSWVKWRGDEPGVLFTAVNKAGKVARVTEKDIERYQKARALLQNDPLADLKMNHKYSDSIIGEYRALNSTSINKIMARWITLAGIENATPHDLRYTFAQSNLKRTSDLQTVCDLLGHASISTTSIYTQSSEEKMRNAISKENLFSYKN